MELKDLIGESGNALVEYYDNSAACDEANRITEEVKELLGANAPVFRINVADTPREASLVRLKTVPTIIIYRNHREENVMTSNFPPASQLAEELKQSMIPAGAESPLKGRHY